MLSRWNQPRIRMIASLILAATTVAVVEAGGPFRNPFRERTSVEQLAEKIDKLERHIDAYGSVVAKTPDVWGEARLTKYRRDVEGVLSDQVTKFAPTISATISRSDQAFLTSSLALQAALGGRQAALISPTQNVQFEETKTVVLDKNMQPVLDPEGNLIFTTVKTPKIVSKETISAQGIPSAPPDVSASFSTRSSLLSASSGTGGFANSNAVGLEPTVVLDQLQRYLDHLNQLRRNNDGDDQSASPGYAMHLVRIPVSVQPGNLTKEGYGAEINIIAKPHLHEKLLQETFRGLVINDIIDQLALPMAKLIDRKDADDVIHAAQRETVLKKELADAQSSFNSFVDTHQTNQTGSGTGKNEYYTATMRQAKLQDIRSDIKQAKTALPNVQPNWLVAPFRVIDIRGNKPKDADVDKALKIAEEADAAATQKEQLIKSVVTKPYLRNSGVGLGYSLS